MDQQNKGILHRLWDRERGPYALLVITAVTVFVTSPLVVSGAVSPVALDVFFAVFLFVGVLTVHPGRGLRLRYLVLVLAIFSLLMRIASNFVLNRAVLLTENLIGSAAIAIFGSLVMKQFLVSGRRAAHRIVAAIVVYLLIGVLWARLYEIAGLMIPGAFNIANGTATITSYLYFSFVTLATIGYGDITPVHSVVRNLAVLEAITGQMYIAVLIAQLVASSRLAAGSGKD